MTNSKFIDVPQEVEEWFSRLDEKDMIPMAAQAVEYAINYLGRPYWSVLSELIDLCCQGKGATPLKNIPLDEEILLQTVRETIELVSERLGRDPGSVAAEALISICDDPRFIEFNEQQVLLKPAPITSYGVFLSNDAVRVRKVLSLTTQADLTKAEKEAYDNDFKIAHYPGEYSGRIVEAPDRDMAIYTAGLLDGVDQVESRLEEYDSSDLGEDRCASGHTV